MNNIDKLAEMVARDFESTVKEEEFDNFIEMKECYGWTSQDIRNEVYYMVNNTYESERWMVLDDDDLYHMSENGITDEECTYRKFINAVYKVMKADGLYA